MFASYLKKFFPPRGSPRCERIILFLEPLEDRYLPSTLTWHFRVGNPTNWTVVNNWDVAPNQPATEYPGQNRNTDTAQFDGTSVDTCTLNTRVTLSGIIITSNYTGQISFLQGNSMTIAGNNSDMAGGTMGGDLGLYINQNATFKWEGGSILITGSHWAVNSGTFNIAGSVSKTLGGGNFLMNNGTMNWTAGDIVLKNAGKIWTNTPAGQATAVFNASAAASINDTTGDGVFWIGQEPTAATLNVNPGAGNVTTFHASFATTAQSTTNIQSGTMLANLGSDWRGTATNNGTATISGGAQLTLSSWGGSLVDKLDGVKITGSGTLNLTGHVSVVAPSTIDNQTTYDSDVSLDGSNDLTINKTYYWNSGSWSGSGKMIIKGSLILNNTLVGGYPLGRTIDNFNVVTWSASDIQVSNGANIINEAGATFDNQVDANILDGGAGTFQNSGLLIKSGGKGTTRIDIQFNPLAGGKVQDGVTGGGVGKIDFKKKVANAGAIEVDGAGIDFLAGFEQDAGGSTLLQASGATMTVSGGNLVQLGGTMTGNPQTTFSVTGQYQESGDSTTSTTLTYSSLTVTDQIIVSGGTMQLNYSTLWATTNGVQISASGILQGVGTLNLGNSVLFNSGTINPGHTGNMASLSVNGGYTQTSTGVLNVAIYTSNGTSSYDQLNVSGVATLGGTLNVSSGSSPQPQTAFYLVKYASRAGTTFATINLPPLMTGHWVDGYSDGNPGGFYVEDVVH